MKVTAFEVDHAPVKPAFGYRIDMPDVPSCCRVTPASLTIYPARSGGGCFASMNSLCPNPQRMGVPPNRAKNIVASCDPGAGGGGLYASEAKIGGVFAHFLPNATDQELLSPTRKTYAGPLELGEDLMTIEVGEKIEVRRPGRSTP